MLLLLLVVCSLLSCLFVCICLFAGLLAAPADKILYAAGLELTGMNKKDRTEPNVLYAAGPNRAEPKMICSRTKILYAAGPKYYMQQDQYYYMQQDQNIICSRTEPSRPNRTEPNRTVEFRNRPEPNAEPNRPEA